MAEIAKPGGFIRQDVGKREWVDFVKGVAIILIVAYHTVLFLHSVGIDVDGVGRAKVVLELFPMPAFLLISGMFHTRVPSWSFNDLWRRRLRQYLYLYVLWSVIRFVFYLVARNVREDGAGQTAQDPLALLGILVWPISSYWFIYALFVFTLVLWLFRKAPPWVLVTVATVLSLLSSSGILDARNVGINRMTEYLIFFVIGAMFNRKVYGAVDAMKPWKATALVVGFLAFGSLAAFMPALSHVPGVAFAGQLLAVATGFALSYYLVRLAILKWVLYVGVRSFNIYLVHVFVIAVLVAALTLIPRIVDALPGRGIVLTAILVPLIVLLSIVIARFLTRVSWLFVYPFRGRKKVDHSSGPDEAGRPVRRAANTQGEERP